MGTATRNALKLAAGASILLAVLSVLKWATVWDFGEFVGPGAVRSVHGTSMHNVTSIGDGTALLIGSLMTLAVAVYALQNRAARLAAGATIAVTGFAMSAVAAYDCLHVGGVDFSSSLGFVGSDPWLRLTVVPYLAAVTGWVIGTSGLVAAVTAEPDGVPELQPRGLSAPTSQAMRLVLWASVAVAFLAFATQVDAGTLGVASTNGHAVIKLSDAIVLGFVALFSAQMALQMLRDPNELAWAMLVVGSSVAFVLAGNNLSTHEPQCQSSSDILGFLNTGACLAHEGFTAGTAALWLTMCIGATGATLALSLPIIETYAREQTTLEKS